MNTRPTLVRSLTALALLTAAPALASGQSGSERESFPARKQLIPARPIALVSAHPFELEKDVLFHSLGKRSKHKKGWILVLKADLKLLEPRNAPDYVLFVGDHVARRINSGYKDGHLVVMIPDCDLEKTTLWFGSRLVPDKMLRQDFELDALRAKNASIAPFSRRDVRTATKIGGKLQKAHDLNELWYLQRHLIERYAPAEKKMARSLRPGRRG